MITDMKALQRAARAQGWSVRTDRRHMQLVPPDRSCPVVTVGCTLSDQRAWRNVRRELRHSGWVG